MAGWKRKGWRKADGKPVMNVELLQQLDEALAGRRYRFEWVKGHVGHELNEAADTRARAVAEAYRRGGDVPVGSRLDRRAHVARGRSEPSSRGGARARRRLRGAVPRTVRADPTRSTAPTTPRSSPRRRARGVAHAHLELSTEEHDRLVQRARAEGVSPEEFLRGLI